MTPDDFISDYLIPALAPMVGQRVHMVMGRVWIDAGDTEGLRLTKAAFRAAEAKWLDDHGYADADDDVRLTILHLAGIRS